MTQMTLMTLNPGYGIGYPQNSVTSGICVTIVTARNVPGVWGTPQKCVCGYPNAMLAKHVYPQNGDNQTGYPYKFVYAPE